MARIHQAFERAGWRLDRIRSDAKWSPGSRAVSLAPDVAGDARVFAEMHVDVGEPRTGAVRVVADLRAGDAPELGAEVGRLISGLLAALDQCPGGYPLTREEHAAQRLKMMANDVYQNDHRGMRMPSAGDGFPADRAAPAGAGTEAGAEEHEPET